MFTDIRELQSLQMALPYYHGDAQNHGGKMNGAAYWQSDNASNVYGPDAGDVLLTFRCI